MAPLLNITGRSAVRVLRKIRFSSGSLPVTGLRTLSTSSRALSNIVTSPFPDVQLPSGNVMNTIFENVDKWGSKTAVECSETGRNFTYNQLLDGISKWAGFLRNLGLTKGDVIAIYMPNCLEYPIVMLGAISIGVVTTTINNNYTAEEVARQLKDSRAQLLVGIPGLEASILSSLTMHKSPLHLVMNGPCSAPGAFNLHHILQDPAIPYADSVEVPHTELAAMPYSSGTTGRPKGVTISHGAFSSSIRMFTHPSVFATSFATEEYQSTYMCLLPFYHIYGMLVLMMIGFHAGAKVITMPGFDPNSFIDTVQKNKVEVLHLVPPMLNFLVKSPLATRENMASVKSMLVGAAPVAPSAAEMFKDKFNKDVFVQEGYGMTEVLITNKTPIGSNRIGSCGPLLSNVSGKVIDTATGEDIPPSQTGEICIKTPSMMNGYFQNEEATSSTIDEEGWLHTGDVGFFDQDGFLKIVDRTKELIKVKGLQVSPSELEDIIRQHPQVMDVGVVGIPNDRLGEAPRAYVVAKREISEEDIHRFIEDRAAPHKKLAGGVNFVKELPKTGTGKLLRRELKLMAIE